MEVEQEAQLLGWVPQDVFRGDPAKWTSAEEFVERGKHIMPILRKNNEKLIGEIDGMKSTIATLQGSVAASLESMEALKVFHAESSAAQVAKVRREILADLKEAKTDGDVDAEIEATAKLSQFDTAQVAAKAPTARASVAPQAAPISPEVKTWMAENPWYGTDQERTGMATGVANRLRAEGDKRVGREFLEEVGRVVEERLGSGETRQATSKVEGSRGGSGQRSGGTDYASLPADAREVCDRQAKKFVGTDRAFKTSKEWNAHFAEQYHKGN